MTAYVCRAARTAETKRDSGGRLLRRLFLKGLEVRNKFYLKSGLIPRRSYGSRLPRFKQSSAYRNKEASME
jgi:endonuclease YncB( thermonuclease family)